MSETRSGLRDDPVPIVTLGLALSAFFGITFLLCLSLLLVIPNVGMHLPLFRFLPGFNVSATGIAIGLVETVAYGWYAALLFGWLFNFFASARE